MLKFNMHCPSNHLSHFAMKWDFLVLLPVNIFVEKTENALRQNILLKNNPKNVWVALIESVPQDILFTGEGMSG